MFVFRNAEIQPSPEVKSLREVEVAARNGDYGDAGPFVLGILNRASEDVRKARANGADNHESYTHRNPARADGRWA